MNDVAIEERLTRLEDLAAIHQLFVDYGEHLDAGDFDAYAQLFAEDGEVLLGPMGRAKGREAIRDLMTAALADRVGSTYHIVSSPRVALDGDTASSTVMWSVAAMADDGLARVTMLGHHVDQLVKRDGRWWFQRREGVVNLPSTLPRSEASIPGRVVVGERPVQRMIDQQSIRDVVYRYCRGIDRCDYELVRSCYHADATADHGDYRGDIDGFLSYVQQGLPRDGRTMHFIGNVLIEIDDATPDRARAESYLVANHRLPTSRTKPERDFVAGLRYVDDFERREGSWRIATRVCVFEWSRIDPVPPGGWVPSEASIVGRRDRSDAVYAASLDLRP